MKLRTGRRNPHNLYIQVGDNPSDDDDISIGYIKYPQLTPLIVEGFNSSSEVNSLLAGLVSEGDGE